MGRHYPEVCGHSQVVFEWCCPPVFARPREAPRRQEGVPNRSARRRPSGARARRRRVLQSEVASDIGLTTEDAVVVVDVDQSSPWAEGGAPARDEAPRAALHVLGPHSTRRGRPGLDLVVRVADVAQPEDLLDLGREAALAAARYEEGDGRVFVWLALAQDVVHRVPRLEDGDDATTGGGLILVRTYEESKRASTRLYFAPSLGAIIASRRRRLPRRGFGVPVGCAA